MITGRDKRTNEMSGSEIDIETLIIPESQNRFCCLNISSLFFMISWINVWQLLCEKERDRFCRFLSGLEFSRSIKIYWWKFCQHDECLVRKFDSCSFHNLESFRCAQNSSLFSNHVVLMDSNAYGNVEKWKKSLFFSSQFLN